MGTKNEFVELQELLKDEVRSHPFLSREWKESDRRYKLADILNDLGFLPEYDGEYDAIAVEYRNHRYVCDVIKVNILSIFSVVAQFDEDDLDEEEILAIMDAVQDANICDVMAKVYVVGGEIVVSSEQFLGKRKIEEDEVAFLIKCVDHVARVFWENVKCNELINDYVVCR